MTQKIKVLQNQVLFQTLEKIQVLQTCIFFRSSPWKKLSLYYKPEKNPGARPGKKSRCAEPEIFLGFERYLDFSRPRFSEIRVQIKRLMEIKVHTHRHNFSCHSFPEMTNVQQNNVTFKRRSREQWCTTFLSIQTSQTGLLTNLNFKKQRPTNKQKIVLHLWKLSVCYKITSHSKQGVVNGRVQCCMTFIAVETSQI